MVWNINFASFFFLLFVAVAESEAEVIPTYFFRYMSFQGSLKVSSFLWPLYGYKSRKWAAEPEKKKKIRASKVAFIAFIRHLGR